MQKVRVPINSFQFGEVSDSLTMRTDSPVYAQSAKSLENMVVMSEGSVKKRYGLKHIYDYSITYDANNPAQSHLFKFIFDENEEYIISVEHQKIRCFRLLSDGTISLVSTLTADVDSAALPFDQDYLQEYTTAQYGDVMFICHPLFMPRMLTRTSLTSFEVSTYAFDTRADNNVTYQPYSKFHAQGVTLDPSATTGTGVTLTTSSDYWDITGTQTGGNYLDSKHVGSVIRYGGNEIEIKSVQSATQATGDIVDELRIRLSVLNPLRTIDGSATVEVTHINHGFGGGESITIEEASAVGGINTGNLNGARTVGDIIDENTYTFTAGGAANESTDGGGYVKIVCHAPTDDWDEQAYSAKRGYPAAVTFHENRLCFGGTLAEPDTIWMSQIGEFFNFDEGEAADSEAITLTAATGDVNEIRYLISNRDLQVFTASGELYIPTYLNQAITPTNAQIRKQTPYGSSFVQPVSIDGATVFVQQNGKVAREYLYSDSEDAYVATAVSTIASHLINDPKCMAVVHSGFGLPDSYAALTLGNGDMALFSSNRAERRASWTRVTTDGDFCSVVAIEDRLFVNVWYDDQLHLCEFDGDIGLDKYKEVETSLPYVEVDTDFAEDLIFNNEVVNSSLITRNTINNATLTQSLNTTDDAGDERSFFIKPDNKIVYMLDAEADGFTFKPKVNVYNFTSGSEGDLTALTYDSSYVIDDTYRSSNVDDFLFSNDGLRIYVLRTPNVDQYNLSTAWDLSTASYDSRKEFTGVGDSFAANVSIGISPDGTKFYITDSLNSDRTLNQYAMSTPFSISSIDPSTIDAQDILPSSITDPTAFCFSADGKRLIVSSVNGNAVEKILDTAWTVDTNSYTTSYTLPSGGFTQVLRTVLDDSYIYSLKWYFPDGILGPIEYIIRRYQPTSTSSRYVNVSDWGNPTSGTLYYGKKFTARIETNEIDASMGAGPATGTKRGITNVVVDFKDTDSAKVNSSKLTETSTFSGKKEFRVLGYSRSPTVIIEQDDPLPMQVNGIVAELIT